MLIPSTGAISCEFLFALNLSGIGLKQPNGKGIIGGLDAVLDCKLGIEGPGMGT